jgi:hypothetical protein
MILLLQPPEYWDYRYSLPSPAPTVMVFEDVAFGEVIRVRLVAKERVA